MNKYAVSIILPCYNVAQYIERAIDSILVQDFKDYEIIIINDGSTDELLQVCNDKILIEGESKIKLLSFKNQGLSQARNEGLKVAQGEYVYFFDPDDYINQGMLSKVYSKAKEGDYDAVHFGFHIIYETQGGIHFDVAESPYIYQTNDEIIHDYLPRFLGITQENINNFIDLSHLWNSKQFAGVPLFLYKRSVLIENNVLFPKGIKLVEDKIFNARFFCYAETIALMDDVLYNYIVKEKGIMTSSLNDAKGLVVDKIAGVEQRAILRNLYLKERNIDIFPYYIGTIVFSALELIMKLSDTSFFSSQKELKRYMSLEDVKIGVKEINVAHLPLKLRLPIVMLKYNLTNLLLFGMRILKMIGLKVNI
jgi:Glycosyltransferases involved in cell wall biogenesis